jgi:DNA-binding winged helix-turn-helix (wHTH) protein/tetratricopeptide (TPR) repeat protein
MNTVQRIDLAHEPEFALGQLLVSPPRREVTGPDGQRHIVQHRVMQVLIALVRAKGSIVTRDELTASCWDGRIVGEDAINRVISQLRKLARTTGDEGLLIETLPKIGYRLPGDLGPTDGVGTGPKAEPDRQERRIGRRAFAFGTLALGVLGATGAGTFLYRQRARDSALEEASALMAQAKHLATQNTREGQNQSLGLLRRAVEIAPDFADAWGALGIAYGVSSHYRPRAEGEALRMRAEAAAMRAFELEPGNVFGEVALGCAAPFIGSYLERDRHFARALAKEPRNEDALIYSAVTLQFVGRASDAIPLYERVSERPLRPADYNNYILALWSAGRIEECERAMIDAAALYPSQSSIWFTRVNILTYTARTAAALALVRDPEMRPGSVDEVSVAELIALAEAIETREAARIAAVTRSLLASARRTAALANAAIRDLSALGQVDQAFAVANAYYFGRGFRVPDFPPPGDTVSQDQRQTRLLFEPVTAPLRRDPRFERLVRAIGLDDYWRASGIQPDYRRN